MAGESDFRLRIHRELLDRLVDLMQNAVGADSGNEARIRRAIERMRNAPGHGGITWTRQDLYRY
jgi:hypothetical protein